MIRYTIIPSPIGELTAVCEDGCLTALHLHPVIMPEEALRDESDTVLEKTKLWLNDYFCGKAPNIELPLRPKGTAFQQSVWALLVKIPYGKTVTYGQLAAEFSGRMSAQAIGQAVGRNPINIIIPCHRVLGAGCRITGYSGGLDIKRYLLELEGIPYR